MTNGHADDADTAATSPQAEDLLKFHATRVLEILFRRTVSTAARKSSDIEELAAHYSEIERLAELIGEGATDSALNEVNSQFEWELEPED